jgi:hypothetical protein
MLSASEAVEAAVVWMVLVLAQEPVRVVEVVVGIAPN